MEGTCRFGHFVYSRKWSTGPRPWRRQLMTGTADDSRCFDVLTRCTLIAQYQPQNQRVEPGSYTSSLLCSPSTTTSQSWFKVSGDVAANIKISHCKCIQENHLVIWLWHSCLQFQALSRTHIFSDFRTHVSAAWNQRTQLALTCLFDMLILHAINFLN